MRYCHFGVSPVNYSDSNFVLLACGLGQYSFHLVIPRVYFRQSFSSGDFRIRRAHVAGFSCVLFYFFQTVNQSDKLEVAISNYILYFFLPLDIDDCKPNPCKNGARCTDKVNGYTCTCARGYSGTRCEISKLQNTAY